MYLCVALGFSLRHVLNYSPALHVFQDLLYLTVIVQCRNDDYGGNMLLRLNRMLATTTRMLHTTQVPSEIIVVDAQRQVKRDLGAGRGGHSWKLVWTCLPVVQLFITSCDALSIPGSK